jgi:hypothetical protein
MRDAPAQIDGGTAQVPDIPSKQEKPGLKERAIDEGKKMLVMVLYLWVFFAVLSLHRTAVLQNNGVSYTEQGFAIVNALIFAKVMLIADDLKFGRRFTSRPLIYSVLYASLAFAVLLVCFHITEGVVTALLRGRPVADSLSDFGAGNLRGVVSIGAIVFVALIPFFMYREIGRVVGEGQLWKLLVARDRKRFRLVEQN